MNIKEMIKAKTVKFRKQVVLGVAKTLTPLLHQEFMEIDQYVGRTPRPFTLMLKETFGSKPLVGVEIGFGCGGNACSLLNILNLKRLYCVDVKLNKTIWQNRPDVDFVEMPSDNAFEVLPKDTDFIYVDGCHDYSQVLRDLKHYYPLVREGGFIGGHDFHKSCPGVVQAVLEFAVSAQSVPTVVMPDFWFSKERDSL